MKKRKVKKEINRCKKDLAYFFEKYVKFVTLNGDIVSNTLTKAQKHILKHCEEGNQKH